LGFFPNTSSGDVVGITSAQGLFVVPTGYVSGAALLDSMTFNNATFAGAPMAAQQFLCSVLLCSAWLRSDAS